MPDSVTATGYLVVGGERSRYGAKDVIRAKPRRITLGRPKLSTDEIAVKISVRVPVAAFGPFEASAVVDIPEDLIAANNVEVVASDANA